MKKQFQISGIAIIMTIFSCGKDNADIPVANTTGVNELLITNMSAHRDPELLLIGTEDMTRFNAGMKDHSKKVWYKPSSKKGTSFTIDRSELAKTIIRLNGPYGVN